MSAGRVAVAAADRDWSGVLDEYEAVLDRQAAALADADLDPEQVGRFEPPIGLGPLPDALRARAASLAARTDELVGTAERLLGDRPVPTARPRPRRPARHATFDQRA